MKKIVRIIALVLIVATLSLFMVACTGSKKESKTYEQHFKNLLALVSEDKESTIALYIVGDKQKEEADYPEGLLAYLYYGNDNTGLQFFYFENEKTASSALLNGISNNDGFMQKGSVLYNDETRYNLVSEKKKYTLSEEKGRVFDMAMLFSREEYSVAAQFQKINNGEYEDGIYCQIAIVNETEEFEYGEILFFVDEDSAMEYWLENKQSLKNTNENAKRDGNMIVNLGKELKKIYDNK